MHDLVSDTERGIKYVLLLQATINLIIGYEAPAKASSDDNDQPDGVGSHGDAGMIGAAHQGQQKC